MKYQSLLTKALLLLVTLLFINCQDELIDAPKEIKSEQENTYLKVDELNFERLEQDVSFQSLRTKFNISQPTFNRKKGTYQSQARTSGASNSNDYWIDMSIVNKVTMENYMSYTMRLVEPLDTSNSYSNIVIQEYNGIEEIFTIRYTDNSSARTTGENGGMNMKPGIIPYDGWDDPNDGDNSSGGDGYEYVCRDVIQIIDVPCTGNNHTVGQSCECQITDFNCQRAYQTLGYQNSCSWEYVDGNTNGTGNPNNDPGTTGGSTSDPTNSKVVTKKLPIEIPLEILQSVIECIGVAGDRLIWMNNEMNDANRGPQLLSITNHFTQLGGSCEDVTREDKEFMLGFIDIAKKIKDAKLERYEVLIEKIKEDPWALIQDCAEQNGMDTSNYLDLFNHTIPQDCQTRLNNLGADYSNQPISDGNVSCANIDYYSVEITNYPDFDNDGNSDTEAEIYQAFREKFTDLASGEKDSFESECNVPADFDDVIDIWWKFNPMSDFDSNLFLSNNPISSIMLIDAGANNPFVNTNADLGAIIVSGFTSTNWTISTIQTPETETQPFSGNRQWGLLINQNGNLEFYTRAVDVARVADIFLEWPATWLGSDIDCQQDTYYDIAEATWQNMQQEIADWINDDQISHGGQATVNTPKAARVNKDKIIEILTTNESIEQILSNCD